jgi:hypothetical protein
MVVTLMATTEQMEPLVTQVVASMVEQMGE